MKQVITAKFKLNLSQEQKSLLREVSLSYRDALNYVSQVAFDNSRTSTANQLSIKQIIIKGEEKVYSAKALGQLKDD